MATVVEEITPTGHLQVRPDKNGRGRHYIAGWWDAEGEHKKKLGPAHVRDSGRRTARGAVVWRRGDGPKPTAEHLVPQEAQELLKKILSEAPTQQVVGEVVDHTLHEAVDRQQAERKKRRGLKRSTTDDYGDLWERVFRDVGEDTPMGDLLDFDWTGYFEDFQAQRIVGRAKAIELRKDGADVRETTISRWTAQPADSVAIEVGSRGEAVRLAQELHGTWKHRRRGGAKPYRVTPGGAQRARRVSRAEAKRLEAEGWVIERRHLKRWLVCAPAANQTINKYRDLLAAVFAWAVKERWTDGNPLDDVPRLSKKADRIRVLRRDDFYDRREVRRLLAEVEDDLERAFFLCGFHEGFRLPGEALGLSWGAVDFEARVLRPYDNWVRNELDTTKTPNFAPVPMTTETFDALWKLYQRGFCTGDDDPVFTRDASGQRASEKDLRAAFKRAVDAAGLKVIPMYNARHSFGTGLARHGVDVRTIQALMRHERQETTQMYMAYAPQEDLAQRMDAALSFARDAAARSTGNVVDAFFERVDEEVPAKWAREMRRICDETGLRAGAG
jgi:integrase